MLALDLEIKFCNINISGMSGYNWFKTEMNKKIDVKVVNCGIGN